MAFGYFVIPFLVAGPPELPPIAMATSKGLIHVIFGQGAVGVDVGEFAVVGGHRRGVVFLLSRSKAQNSFSFA